MVGAAWLLAARMGGAFAACVALLTAVSVECVTTSHVACTDTLTACFVSLRWPLPLRRPQLATWAAAVAPLAGLATGMKFSGASVGPFVLLVAIVNAARVRRPGLAARDAASSANAIAALVLTTPRFFMDLGDYMARLRYEGAVQRYGQLGHVQYGWFDYLFSMTTTPEQPWLYTSLVVNIGPLLLATAGIAVVLAWPVARANGRDRGVIRCRIPGTRERSRPFEGSAIPVVDLAGVFAMVGCWSSA